MKSSASPRYVIGTRVQAVTNIPIAIDTLIRRHEHGAVMELTAWLGPQQVNIKWDVVHEGLRWEENETWLESTDLRIAPLKDEEQPKPTLLQRARVATWGPGAMAAALLLALAAGDAWQPLEKLFGTDATATATIKVMEAAIVQPVIKKTRGAILYVNYKFEQVGDCQGTVDRTWATPAHDGGPEELIHQSGLFHSAPGVHERLLAVDIPPMLSLGPHTYEGAVMLKCGSRRVVQRTSPLNFELVPPE